MQARALFIATLLVVLACSKSSDPAPAATGKCTVIFKGSPYELTQEVTCREHAGVGDDVSAKDATGKVFLSVANFGAGGGTIWFATNTMDTDANYYISILISGTTPTINHTGNSWTFSGTAKNQAGDTGELSGSCKCN